MIITVDTRKVILMSRKFWIGLSVAGLSALALAWAQGVREAKGAESTRRAAVGVQGWRLLVQPRRAVDRREACSVLRADPE